MRKLTLMIGLFALVSMAIGQNRLTPELLWELDRVGAPTASPDGKYIAFTVSDYDWKTNSSRTDIYFMSTKGGEAKKLTGEMTKSSWSPEWRSDSKYIGFMSANAGEPQMFELEIENPTNYRQVTNQEGGITGFHYSKAMNKVVYSTNVKLRETTVDKYPDLLYAT